MYLSLLFNSLIKHCFVPADFCFGIIVPLLKSKHGDASQIDMYRGITLSTCVSKLFEKVLVEIFGEALMCCSMVLRRIAVQAMLSLASVNLCGTLRPKVVRFTVYHWMPVRLLIG